MDEAKIRQIIRDEMKRVDSADRFGFTNIPAHTHNGVDSLKVMADKLIPSCSIVGSIEMSTLDQTYTIYLNSSFTPQRIVAHSIVSNSSGEIYRGFYYGEAQLVPSFYLQTNTSDSVTTGTKQYPFPTELFNGTTKVVPAQSSSGLLVSRSTDANVFANQSEDHIVSAYVGLSDSDIRARATVVGFSRDSIQIYVPYLTSGWTITTCFIIS